MKIITFAKCTTETCAFVLLHQQFPVCHTYDGFRRRISTKSDGIGGLPKSSPLQSTCIPLSAAIPSIFAPKAVDLFADNEIRFDFV